MFKTFCIILLSTMMISCSTMKQSLLTGTLSGAAVGAGTNAVYSSKNKGKAALTGALIGAAIGGISSFFIHKEVKKKEDRVRRETLFNLDKYNVGSKSKRSGLPLQISAPQVESEWIDTQVHDGGKTLIEGHRVWKINEGPGFISKNKHE